MPLTISGDQGRHYLLEVGMGVPSQMLGLIFDTGTSDIMLLNHSYCQVLVVLAGSRKTALFSRSRCVSAVKM